jgi:PTH1 family peptidyl-tRNA hydrolase
MIKLIAGLGNPGKDYQEHRHNAGFWFIELLANNLDSKFSSQSKFFGETTTCLIGTNKVRLLKPKTFMNNSGQSVKALSSYYNIEAEEILVIHDDLDLTPGSVKIKMGGGHGGHNGLKDTIKALGTNGFYRLRLGIGHPGSKNEVVDFVLSPPGKTDLVLIEQAIKEAMDIIEPLASGDFEQAIKQLHTD